MPDDTTPDADDDESPSVLLLHGHPGPSLIWTKLQTRLRGHGLRVLALDRSDQERDRSAAPDQFGTAAALTRPGDEPVVVVAHSAGTRIALTMAATAPQRVRALVLLAPAETPAAITAADQLLAAPVLGPALAWLGFRTAGVLLHLQPMRQRLLIERAGLNVADAKGVVRLITHGTVWRRFTIEHRLLLADARGMHQQLRDVRCPVVIVAGQRDNIADPGVASDLARRLPGAIMVTTNTGHRIPFDDPDAVVDAIFRVLRLEYQQSLSRRPSKPTRANAMDAS